MKLRAKSIAGSLCCPSCKFPLEFVGYAMKHEKHYGSAELLRDPDGDPES